MCRQSRVRGKLNGEIYQEDGDPVENPAGAPAWALINEGKRVFVIVCVGTLSILHMRRHLGRHGPSVSGDRYIQQKQYTQLATKSWNETDATLTFVF